MVAAVAGLVVTDPAYSGDPHHLIRQPTAWQDQRMANEELEQ
jgi:hypothetical protein